MKKLTILFIISFLFVSMLLGSNIDKFEQEKLFQQQNSLNAEHIGSYSTPSRDAGDILFQFNPPMSPWGVGYDGEFLWLSDAVAGDTNIYQYATDGTATGASLNCPWMGSFLGDMANTPGFIFIVNVGGDNNIYKIDEVTGNVEEIIAGAWNFVSARGLAHDPDANEFYIGGWNHTEIYHIDATGATIGTFPFASVSGLAWHPMGNNGAGTLFVTESAPTNNIYEVDPTSGAIIQQFTSPGADYACAGLALDSTGNLWAIDQGTNTVYNIDSGVPMGDPGAPAAPTDFVIVPDPGGALSADLSWVCPTLTIDGSALTELNEMQLYRGEDLIYTDTDPTIGGPGSYTDVVPASGSYSYSVFGVNSQGDGIPASIGSWIGEDVPAAVTDLLLEESNGNGYLTWVNPTTGLNGGAFNNPILGYHIERNDGVVFEVTGEVTYYTDNTIPGADYYDYTVTVYNSVGDGGVATSNTVMIGAGDEIFFDDFEAGLGNWNSIINSGVGEWLIYSPPFPNAYNMPPTSSGNVCSADSDEAGSGTTTDCTIELVSTLDLTGYTTVNIQFDNDFNAIATDDYCYVDVTTDGTTWDNVLTFAGVDVTATHEIIDVTAFVAGHPSVNVRFHSVQPGWDWWWTIDNVGIYGTGAPVDPGFIEGTVEIADGAGNVEDVVVEAGGYTTNPAADGTYSLEIQPGTYNVTATLTGYDSQTIPDIVVTEGTATTGVDFSLVTDGDDIVVATTMLIGNYPNPFNPVTNIAYSIHDAGNVTIEVYNLRGQLVKTLVNEVKETGDHTAIWDGTDNTNKSVSSGVYFYKMVSMGSISTYTSSKKMILMK